jgi:hypothetical protein
MTEIEPKQALQGTRKQLRAPELSVLGDCVAENRGADFVKPLAPALCARTRSLTRHRALHNQATLACASHGVG